MSNKRNAPAGFPEVAGESLFDRRIRLIIWKQKNGIRTGNLSTRRITVKALQCKIDALESRVKELEAGKVHGGGQSTGQDFQH